MKNASYFTLEALFVLKIFKFCIDILVMWKNGLIRNVRLTSNSMTSQLGWQTIVIYIFTNISKSKDNQAIEFGQLIEYNIRNIFLEKLKTKCGRETIPKLFSKNSNLSISLDQYSKILYILS